MSSPLIGVARFALRMLEHCLFPPCVFLLGVLGVARTRPPATPPPCTGRL
jgi:hypothetical protein